MKHHLRNVVLGVLVVIACVAIPVLFLALGTNMARNSKLSTVQCHVTLPAGHGIMVLERRQIDSYLAEYSRSLFFVYPSGRSSTIELPLNPGGNHAIEVMWYSDTSTNEWFVILQDHTGRYVVDGPRGAAAMVVYVNGVAYLGPMSREVDGSVLKGVNDEGEVSVYIGDAKALETLQFADNSRLERLGIIDEGWRFSTDASRTTKGATANLGL